MHVRDAGEAMVATFLDEMARGLARDARTAMDELAKKHPGCDVAILDVYMDGGELALEFGVWVDGGKLTFIAGLCDTAATITAAAEKLIAAGG